MTQTPQSMDELMARIERAIQRLVDAIAPLSPAQLEEPRLAGGRSVKDVLAHVIWWDQWLLMTLPPDPHAAHPPVRPPLADQIPPTNDWADEMNQKVFVYSQPRELAAIMDEFTSTRMLLVQRVARLSHQDLYDPDGMSAIVGLPVAPLVLGIYEHYEEHAHEFEGLR